MGEIAGLEPKCVFEYFEKITKIPRPSKKERAISDYLVAFAKEHNLWFERDKALNVIIKKDATEGYESARPVILQGHMDMVCVADEGTDIDFSKDGIDAYVDGDYIKARGTSLGADNGIAIAMILAILADDTIIHPPIEALFTSDEEEGMGGAGAFDVSLLSGTRLINIDTEEEENMVVGCAGGCRDTVFLPLKSRKAKGIIYEIKIGNLHGGHSGTDIDKNYANANILMGRVLKDLSAVCDFQLVKVMGGSKDNAICSSAVAEILVLPSQKDVLIKRMPAVSEEICAEYCVTEPNMKFTLTNMGESSKRVLTKESFDKYVLLVNLIPNGVVRMSQTVPGMVETSLNLGIVTFENKEIRLAYALRSSVLSEMMDLSSKLSLLAKSVGATVMTYGDYPAWQVKNESKLRDIMSSIYRKQFGREYNVMTIHAGLECGVLYEKIGNLDAVSIGPDMHDVHSTSERLSVESVGRMWIYIKNVLKELVNV